MSVIPTTLGAVSGIPLPGCEVFRGIPYAKPPVGPLRFRPPVPAEPWESVRVCDTFGPAPIQRLDLESESFEPYGKDFYWQGMPPVSEDCLYLNIWRPEKEEEEPLPVYIWFHGGGLAHGWSYEPEFDGLGLSQKGVIVVTVGHRLGIFGYLCLPQLTKEQGVSGNYGYQDELLAVLGFTKESRANMARNIMLDRLFGRERAALAPGSRVYVYLWSHAVPGRPEDTGTARDPERLLAYHSSEMWYVFNSLGEGVPPARPWRDSDFHMAELASSLWANFIRTGDPNGSGLPFWPAASEELGWMEFTDPPRGHSGLDEPTDRLLMAFVQQEYGIGGTE